MLSVLISTLLNELGRDGQVLVSDCPTDRLTYPEHHEKVPDRSFWTIATLVVNGASTMLT